MAQERIRMPMSEGGLVRYSDETKSKFIVKPAVVIGLGIAIIIIAVVLHVLYG
jgi:preprotein translocase subunit Sec61beta